MLESSFYIDMKFMKNLLVWTESQNTKYQILGYRRHTVTEFAGLSNNEMFSETYGCITSKYASFIIFNSSFNQVI